MADTRKLAAILAADVAGYSRLTAIDEVGTISRLRALRHELIDPLIAAYHGRIVKTIGDGILVEFPSVVGAVQCALDVQRGMASRNANVAADSRIEFRVGIHLGDVMVESDGDLMGDGVNIAARLEGIAESGGICLSEQAYWQVRDKIGADFAELGDRALKNIARPVRVYSIPPPSNSEPLVKAESHRAEAPGVPPRLSIVVLPFANIGGNPEQEYFVDGVTESLTTDLSRISGSFVIARNTAFTYKGKLVDVKQIGRELNVRYALEGSVQKGGNRLRVNVQLIDTKSGNHLWAERFDKPVADLFDMQDEIVAHLTNQLNAELIAVEARRADEAPDPDSMDLYFQGMAWANRGVTPDYYNRARTCFEHALALDPDNIDALVGIGRVDAQMALAFSDAPAARLLSAEATLTKALSRAPNHPWAHAWLGVVYMRTNRGLQAMAEAERALALDRNLAHAHAIIGHSKTSTGRAEEAEGHIQEALRLSPRDSNIFIWGVVGGTAKLLLGEDEAAVAWLSRSSEANRNYPTTHFLLAAALANLGRQQAAREAVATGLALGPAFNVHRARESFIAQNISGPQVERVLGGLRKAGVPEGN